MKPVASGLWRSLRSPGSERFELHRDPQGWALRGTILVLDATGAAEARYDIRRDATWRTTGADVSLREGAGERTLRIAVADGLVLEYEGGWQAVSGS